MTFPRKQYVLARTRGRNTRFFYGPKLGDLIRAHIKIGDGFQYARQFTRNWRSGVRTSDACYSTEG